MKNRFQDCYEDKKRKRRFTSSLSVSRADIEKGVSDIWQSFNRNVRTIVQRFAKPSGSVRTDVRKNAPSDRNEKAQYLRATRIWSEEMKQVQYKYTENIYTIYYIRNIIPSIITISLS